MGNPYWIAKKGVLELYPRSGYTAAVPIPEIEVTELYVLVLFIGF